MLSTKKKNNYYSNLQLDLILDEVCKHLKLYSTPNKLKNIEIDFNPLLIRNNLNLLSEAIECLKLDDFNLHLENIKDVTSYLNDIKKDKVISSICLFDILHFHNNLKRIKKLFTYIDETKSIREFSEMINLNNEIFNEIEKSLDSYGNIKKDYNQKLVNLYNDLQQVNEQIEIKTQQFINNNKQYLHDTTVSQIDDRICFLVKNTYKNKINGYIVKMTQSELAYYIEPSTLSKLSQSKHAIEFDIENEILSIILNFCQRIKAIANFYINNYEILEQIDILFAKANYAIEKDYIVPILNNTKTLTLTSAGHPLIDNFKLVKNNYNFYNDIDGIIISGINTGGKTISLKTISLSIILTYLAIPICASYASIPFYEAIYVDIDNKQSLANNLSTFSNHISNINSILNICDKNSLVLIDELISGTDPKEAEAISFAIIEKLIEKKSHFITTTHYDSIKNFAYNSTNLLVSSVSFDEKTLVPTYKYIENSLGYSNGIEIASRYFDDKTIIENAYKRYDENKTLNQIQIEKLTQQLNYVEKIKKDLLQQQKTLDEKIESVEVEKNKLIEFEKIKKQEISSKLNSMYQKALNELNSLKLDKNIELIKEKIKLNNKQQTLDKKIKQDINFKVGDYVRLIDLNKLATIVEINDNLCKVCINNSLILNSNFSNLQLEQKKPSNNYFPKNHNKSISSEINLIGKRVDEALVLLNKYLDEAYGLNKQSVKVIHGYGTYQLKNAICNELKKIKYVKGFNDADHFSGGGSCTIVHFK